MSICSTSLNRKVRKVTVKSMLTESTEDALDVADKMAAETNKRYTHEEMFSKLSETVND